MITTIFLWIAIAANWLAAALQIWSTRRSIRRWQVRDRETQRIMTELLAVQEEHAERLAFILWVAKGPIDSPFRERAQELVPDGIIFVPFDNHIH